MTVKGVEMEAVKLLVAQGRYNQINGQVWSSLTQSQRNEVLEIIPITTSFESYAPFCPDPRYYPEWYVDRATMAVNIACPTEALKIATFAFNSNKSPTLRKLLDDIGMYSKLQSLLASAYQSHPSKSSHVVEVLESLRFPLKMMELRIEPWLCSVILTINLGSEINKVLVTKLHAASEDQLYSLSELNCRQVSLHLDPSVKRSIDISTLLRSLRASSEDGLRLAKTILGPAGFDIETPGDLRDALAEIIRDNQSLAVSAADDLSDWSLLEPVLRSNATGLSTVNLELAFECLSHLQPNHQ